jgi:hypothetical protein
LFVFRQLHLVASDCRDFGPDSAAVGPGTADLFLKYFGAFRDFEFG